MRMKKRPKVSGVSDTAIYFFLQRKMSNIVNESGKRKRAYFIRIIRLLEKFDFVNGLIF